MPTFQIISVGTNHRESLVAVRESTTAEAAVTEYKKETPTIVGNAYKAVKVG